MEAYVSRGVWRWPGAKVSLHARTWRRGHVMVLSMGRFQVRELKIEYGVLPGVRFLRRASNVRTDGFAFSVCQENPIACPVLSSLVNCQGSGLHSPLLLVFEVGVARLAFLDSPCGSPRVPPPLACTSPVVAQNARDNGDMRHARSRNRTA